MCGSVLHCPTVSVFDAGQAYEVLNPASTHRDLDLLLATAERNGEGFVQVFKSLKSFVGRLKGYNET